MANTVRTIVIKNVDTTDEVKAEYKDGTLTAWISFKDSGSGTPGWTTIQEVVEKGL